MGQYGPNFFFLANLQPPRLDILVKKNHGKQGPWGSAIQPPVSAQLIMLQMNVVCVSPFFQFPLFPHTHTSAPEGLILGKMQLSLLLIRILTFMAQIKDHLKGFYFQHNFAKIGS